MIRGLSALIRTSITARAGVIGKADKKGDKKGNKKEPAVPPQLIPENLDVINIYKGKSDPEPRPLEEYPSFLRELLYCRLPANLLPQRLFEGHGLSVKGQWRLIRYMRRFRNQYYHELKTGTYFDETKQELNAEEPIPGDDHDDSEGTEEEDLLEEKKVRHLVIEKEEEIESKESVERISEEEEEESRKEELIAQQEEYVQKKLEEFEIKKKGVKIRGKRVHHITQKDRKEMKKVKLLQEKLAKIAGEGESKEEEPEAESKSSKRK